MGAANQPVLLAGEPGSGKTTLCKTLLRFERPHISLPLSPLVSTRDLLTVMKNCCQKNCKENVASLTKQPRFLLFVDDLHEAPYGEQDSVPFNRVLHEGSICKNNNKAKLSLDRCTWKYVIHSRDAATEYLKGRGFIVPYLPLQDIEFQIHELLGHLLSLWIGKSPQ